MALVDEYRKQYAWRDWETALSACPISVGQRVLDLGCGPGDIAAALIERGAKVTGVDVDEALLEAAKARCPSKARFIQLDLKNLELAGEKFDGIWCSFAAAYFTDFETVFSEWVRYLKPGGWICLIEIDDLLGHQPISESTRDLIVRFYESSFQRGGYDFRAGRKLGSVLENQGFKVQTLTLADKELSFSGAADPEVTQAWTQRLNRMKGLQDFAGNNYEKLKTEILSALTSPDHKSQCQVYCAIGRKTGPA